MKPTAPRLIEMASTHFDNQIEIINSFVSQTTIGIAHVIELNANFTAQRDLETSVAEAIHMAGGSSEAAESEMTKVVDHIAAGYASLAAHSILALGLIDRHCRAAKQQITSLTLSSCPAAAMDADVKIDGERLPNRQERRS